MSTQPTTSASTPICNLCGESVSSVLIAKAGHDVYRCTGCRLAFTYPQPEALDEQYDSSYFDLYRRRRPFRLKRAASRLKRIELMMEPGRLLDVGCSLGYVVEAARDRGWDAAGVEISPYAAEEARKMGLDVTAGTLAEAHYPDGSFDCVTMWDVLEHVPDPTEHVGEVNRVLAPGGLVVVGTPNLDHIRFRTKRENWRHLKPAEHIYYFGPSTIARLFRKTGFEPVRPPVFGHRQFPGAFGAALGCLFSRICQPNDVLIAYGAKQ